MSKVLFNFSKKFIPRISETERISLISGTVGFDKDIFSGVSDLKKLSLYKKNNLTNEETSFINNKLNPLLNDVKDYNILKERKIPESNIQRLKDSGIFGMLIPKKYGGLDFKTHGRSQIVQKLASRSGALGVVGMVPNSLGPGELLLKYGTNKQKNYFLPRLATGEFMPCFGLTSWAAGSDAAGSMIDTGKIVSNSGKIEIELNCNKRYITLAPIANLIGLAFKLEDPDKLSDLKEGITLVLLEKDKYPQLEINSHDPLGSGFPNGTIKGNNIKISLESIIGGEGNAGEGWKMLMECLAEGRGVSLPATAVSSSKLATIGAGSYSGIRKQFKTRIGEMEGVQEKLAEMVKETFIITSGQHLINAMLDNGEKPSVISAILKQQSTERARKVINHGMDILGGSGICMGPNNFLASSHIMNPVGITVEGSNTLTRSLIIFGQGLIRSHPQLYDIVKSVESNNSKEFNKLLFLLIKNNLTNLGKTTIPISPIKMHKEYSSLTNYYNYELGKLSRSFALNSNLMLLLGKKFKVAEMLSGRYADIFSNIYLGYSVLWFYENSKEEISIDEGEIILKFVMTSILYDIQELFLDINRNYPKVYGIPKLFSFPYGKRYEKPTDEMIKTISDLIIKKSSIFELLSKNIYIPNDNENLGLMVNNLGLFNKEGEISNEEMEKKEKIREKVCQVDKF